MGHVIQAVYFHSGSSLVLPPASVYYSYKRLPTKKRNPHLQTLYKPKQRKAIVGKRDQTCKLHSRYQMSFFLYLTQTFLYVLLQSWFTFNTLSRSSLQDFLQLQQDLDQLMNIQALFPLQNHSTMEWVRSEETTVGSASPNSLLEQGPREHIPREDAQCTPALRARGLPTHLQLMLVAAPCPPAASFQQSKVSLKMHQDDCSALADSGMLSGSQHTQLCSVPQYYPVRT